MGVWKCIYIKFTLYFKKFMVDINPNIFELFLTSSNCVTCCNQGSSTNTGGFEKFYTHIHVVITMISFCSIYPVTLFEDSDIHPLFCQIFGNSSPSSSGSHNQYFFHQIPSYLNILILSSQYPFRL